jgi:predicted permease
MSSIGQDLRQAVRALRRHPGFTGLGALTVGLAVGANTALFSVAQAVLLDPLPYADPGRLVFVWSELPRAGYARAPLSGPELHDLRAKSRTLQGLAAVWATSASLVEGREPEPLRLGLVTTDFLSLLGVEPQLGRGFEHGDEGPGAPPGVLLSDGLWRRRFAADPRVVGRAVRLDGGWGFRGGVYTVVGVLPAGFRLLLPPEANVPETLDALAPFESDLAHDPRAQYYLRTVGRLAPAATLAAARAEVDAIGAELAAAYPEYAESGRRLYAVGLQADAVHHVRPALVALGAGVACLLLVAAVNLASLLLARVQARRGELSLRAALGAAPARLARQVLLESLLVAGLGAAIGSVLAAGLVALLPLVDPGQLPRLDAVRVDLRVLALALGAALAAGLLAGIAPLRDALRHDLVEALSDAGRGTGGGARQRARSALVVAQLAIGCVLLVGAGLLLRAFVRLQHVDPGFEPAAVTTFRTSLPPARYPTQHRIAEFAAELERRLTGVPGVKAVGLVNQLPLDDVANWSTPYLSAEAEAAGESAAEADARVVSPGYLRAIGAQLVAGRSFEARDDARAPLVVIVDEALAQRAWPWREAVGRRLRVELWRDPGFVEEWAEVVGVVRHVHHHGVAQAPREQVYLPMAQAARSQLGVVVRAALPPESLRGPLRQAVAALDPELALSEPVPLAAAVRRSLGAPRFTTLVAGAFAGLALLLAAVGLYGVVATAVGQRRREFGVRVALGARRADLGRLVLAQGGRLAFVGVGLGLLASLPATRLLAGALYGLDSNDPLVFAAGPLLLVLVALAACAVPAQRASRVDPIATLRQE